LIFSPAAPSFSLQFISKVTCPSTPGEYTAFADESADCPPPRRPAESFSIFGELQTDARAIPTPAEQNVPTISDESGRPLFELKKINQRILLSFHKLVGIIAAGSESPDECLEHIRHLFVSAHYLMDRLRSSQAYENMRHFLRNRIESWRSSGGSSMQRSRKLQI
jgi:hypothetical protein